MVVNHRSVLSCHCSEKNQCSHNPTLLPSWSPAKTPLDVSVTSPSSVIASIPVVVTQFVLSGAIGIAVNFCESEHQDL